MARVGLPVAGYGLGAPLVIMLTRGAFWPVRSNFGNIFRRKPPNVDFFDRSVAGELFSSWEHQNFCHNALYQNFCPGGLWHFGPYLAKSQNCRSNFGHFFMPMPCFFDSELFCYIGITIRIEWMLA